MKLTKTLFLGFISLIVILFAVAYFNHYKDQKERDKELEVGMELYKKGIIKLENIKAGRFGFSGELINESPKTILNVKILLQLVDPDRDMVYKEDSFNIWDDVPPYQIRKFSEIHGLEDAPENIWDELLYTVTEVRVTD